MDNNFHIGVVEDRHDPKAMGRVRVRVFGLHSDDRVNEVTIESLPWSMVMQPANASSTAGGISQLVEGTWVLVMYIDSNKQDPIVIGALPSTVGSQAPDYTKGFSDPFGVYPKWSDGTADTTLAGKPDTYTEHPVYTERARTKVPKVPKAKRYKVSTVAVDAVETAYERSEWVEPELRGGQQSEYPYNNVHEFEGGMLEEFDSTPGNQRVTRMHPSGTYDEVVVDGTRTIKIVGDGYEIILGAKNMYVKGDVNMTVDGSLNQLVKGDYTLEVGGNYYQMIGGSRESKIVFNDVREVGQDVSENVGIDHYVKCGGRRSLIIGNEEYKSVAADSVLEIRGALSSSIGGDENKLNRSNYGSMCLGNSVNTTKGTHTIETVGKIIIDTDINMDIITGTNIKVEVGTDYELTAVNSTSTLDGSLTLNATGPVDIDGSTIDLN